MHINTDIENILQVKKNLGAEIFLWCSRSSQISFYLLCVLEDNLNTLHKICFLHCECLKNAWDFFNILG